MNDPVLPVHLTDLVKQHPADLADVVQRLDLAEAKETMAELPRPVAAAALAEMDRERAAELLDEAPAEAVAEWLKELNAQDAADLVIEMLPEQRTEALAGLPSEQAGRLAELLKYPEDSAGGIMSDRFIALRSDETALQSLTRLRHQTERRPEDVSYLYVTDRSGRLVGVLPIRELLFAPPERPLSEFMLRDIKFVRVDADQESVAREFEHYHFLALPVLDRLGRLLGVIRANDVLSIAQDEATEDMQLMVGVSGEERTLTPWHKSVPKRLPWLYVNLATAFLAAFVVGLFEETIAKWTALVVFLPIVAGQGGNAGMQTLTVIIRDLALGEINPGDGRKALAKELMLGLTNGVAVGVVVGLVGWLWKDSYQLGVVAFGAMVLNQLAAVTAGVVIPLGLKAFRIDPALASSIFLTTVTDVAGFFFFLGMATLALKFLF
jgi:magnesium transporter